MSPSRGLLRDYEPSKVIRMQLFEALIWCNDVPSVTCNYPEPAPPPARLTEVRPVTERPRSLGSAALRWQSYKQYLESRDTDTVYNIYWRQDCPARVEIPQECGRTNITQTRIVNGTPAKKGSWPWQVELPAGIHEILQCPQRS